MNDRADTEPKEILHCVDDIIVAGGLMQNRYFTTLVSGEMSLDSFRRTQQQFYFAVDFFSRPMSALLMRLPRPQQRLGILENVVEEHGNFRADAFHEATFRQFLVSIGCEAPASDEIVPAVHAFNATILAACLSDPLRIGIACLGVIEYAFADISALIGKAVVDRGWVLEAELVHYKLHAEIDKQHAADFFELLIADWTSKQSQIEIEQGFRLGVYAFDRLYRDLLEP
jgi:pyrroloquinoline-quinone synthase